jgi:hypothetical protein
LVDAPELLKTGCYIAGIDAQDLPCRYLIEPVDNVVGQMRVDETPWLAGYTKEKSKHHLHAKKGKSRRKLL